MLLFHMIDRKDLIFEMGRQEGEEGEQEIEEGVHHQEEEGHPQLRVSFHL